MFKAVYIALIEKANLSIFMEYIPNALMRYGFCNKMDSISSNFLNLGDNSYHDVSYKNSANEAFCRKTMNNISTECKVCIRICTIVR